MFFSPMQGVRREKGFEGLEQGSCELVEIRVISICYYPIYEDSKYFLRLKFHDNLFDWGAPHLFGRN